MPCCPFLLSGLRSILGSNAGTRCRNDCRRRDHSPLRQRKLESDAEVRCRYGFCRQNYSSLPLRKLESDANHLSRNDRCRRAIPHCCDDGDAVIRKSGPEIKNRCTKVAVNRENLASIPKSGPEIKNRCTQEGVNRQNPASIRKSGPEIKNRCTKAAHPPARVP